MEGVFFSKIVENSVVNLKNVPSYEVFHLIWKFQKNQESYLKINKIKLKSCKEQDESGHFKMCLQLNTQLQ